MMLKSLAILAALIALGATNTGQKNDSSSLANKNNENKSSPSISVINNQTSHPNTDTADALPVHWYTSPEWWLCIFGLPTLIFIGWQAKETRKAADATRKSAKEMSRQNRNMIAKERARLTVEFEPFEFAERGKGAFVNLIITNHGATNAFIDRARSLICVNIAQWDMNDLELHSQMRIPNAVPPDPKGIKVIEFVSAGNRMIGEIDQETYESVRNRQSKIFAVGYIEFSDVFGTRWRLRFCRRWGGDYSNGSWFFPDEWPEYDNGPRNADGKTNGEEKIMREPPKAPQKVN